MTTRKEHMFKEAKERLHQAITHLQALKSQDADYPEVHEAQEMYNQATTYVQQLKTLENSIDDEGKLISYTWPGSYGVIYLDAHGNPFCANCANDMDYFPEIVVSDIYWEGPPLECEGSCGKLIESEYGDLEENEEE